MKLYRLNDRCEEIKCYERNAYCQALPVLGSDKTENYSSYKEDTKPYKEGGKKRDDVDSLLQVKHGTAPSLLYLNLMNIKNYFLAVENSVIRDDRRIVVTVKLAALIPGAIT